MKIKQIVSETATTAGSVATVEQPLGEVQTRSVSGLESAEKVMKGKAKKKGPYANSISESKKVEEAKLDEEDKIIAPGKGHKLKPGLLDKPINSMNPTDTVKLDVPLLIRLLEYAREDASSDLDLHDLAEKLVARGVRGKTLSMKDYEHVVDECMTGAGVIAGGAQYEGKKVDRMVAHITKSEEESGKSHDEAEDIAWATANKRGMLDNKNKKKRADEGIMDTLKNKFKKKPTQPGMTTWADPKEMNPYVQGRLKQQRLQKQATAGQTAQTQMATNPPASSVAGNNAFGSMISQITQPTKPTFKPTKTGSVAQTSTGMIHAPKASNPNLKAQQPGANTQAPAQQTMPTKPDANRIMNAIMTLDDKGFKSIVEFIRNQIRKGRGA